MMMTAKIAVLDQWNDDSINFFLDGNLVYKL